MRSCPDHRLAGFHYLRRLLFASNAWRDCRWARWHQMVVHSFWCCWQRDRRTCTLRLCDRWRGARACPNKVRRETPVNRVVSSFKDNKQSGSIVEMIWLFRVASMSCTSLMLVTLYSWMLLRFFIWTAVVLGASMEGGGPVGYGAMVVTLLKNQLRILISVISSESYS